VKRRPLGWLKVGSYHSLAQLSISDFSIYFIFTNAHVFQVQSDLWEVSISRYSV